MDPVAYDYKNAFNKTFDGNGYTLSNLLINANEDYNVGLFGTIKKANIGNLNINNINFNYSDKLPLRIGAFAGSIRDESKISNIKINNVGEIRGVRIVGGFSGDIQESYISNVMIDRIKSIIAINEGKHASNAAAAGGFTGFNASVSYNNIILKNIGEISLTNKISTVYTTYIGWFIGRSDQITTSERASEFKNIAIYDVGKLSLQGTYGNDSAYIGSFAGALHSSKKENLQNIFIFLGENSSFNVNWNNSRSKYYGKFIGALNVGLVDFNNMHIYLKNGILKDAYNDFHVSNDFNQYGYIQNKINIHTYTDETQESVYKDFLSKADTIEKPTTPDNPNQPSDSDVILASDDVISANDLNKWLGEIFGGNYWVD
ncbi:hypothetical protein I9T54_02195, partial [Campylobacter peloridis]|nr:hypothetical protein [Campylobacter peloridis]